MPLSDQQKIDLFDRIWQEYVSTHGLGGMSKSDFDALLLWEYAQAMQTADTFHLSSVFRIRESRAKSLLESAAIKFSQLTEAEAWSQLLSALAGVHYHVESLEKGQMRFHLKTPLLFRYLQNQARLADDSLIFNSTSEYVIGNLATLYRILDACWEEQAFGSNWQGKQLEQARKNIRNIIGRIGSQIAENNLEELKSMKKSRLPMMLEHGSKLASIGGFIKELLGTSS
ncbi:hypothetical protein LG198_02310 [Methylobacillus arboreus]|uniref:hypothetical protein n=1 Tax=Methylobacillus arboreus TaxID=755170 RepID=UPI001E46D9E6|nr:hypothetical protein [Methylobacillus arboreus]MCB5189564.1 hypothetical protein [Methylobacillus arboreus]